MKALSLRQPWANLIASGEKTIETRTWKTNYRGEILICSSKYPKIEPYGKAICVATIYDCKPMLKSDTQRACCDWYEGYSWFLKDIRPIVPFDVKGQLNLFEVDDDLIIYKYGK